MPNTPALPPGDFSIEGLDDLPDLPTPDELEELGPRGIRDVAHRALTTLHDMGNSISDYKKALKESEGFSLRSVYDGGLASAGGAMAGGLRGLLLRSDDDDDDDEDEDESESKSKDEEEPGFLKENADLGVALAMFSASALWTGSSGDKYRRSLRLASLGALGAYSGRKSYEYMNGEGDEAVVDDDSDE